VAPVVFTAFVCHVSRSIALSAISRRHLLVGVPASIAAAGLASAQERPERRSLRLAVGGKTTLYHLPLTVAEQLGFFAAEGLEVELQDHAGGGLAEQALLHDKADVAAGGYEHTVLLRERGVNCRAFVALGRAPQAVFGVGARSMPEYRNVWQLKGRRVGVSSVGSSTHWFASMMLARHGLAPSDVEFVNIGTTTAAVDAVREGRVDALSSIDPVISMLEFRNELRVLWDTRSLRGTQDVLGGPMPGGCVYARQDFVVRYPQTAQALTNAVVRALKWLQTAGPRDIVRAVPEAYMYGDRAIYLAALDKAREAFSPDGLLSDDGVLTALRLIARHGAPRGGLSPIAPGATYTNDFARRAKQRYQA
jgi:NitT/TauT family transport system substrate-binding protein